MNPSAKQERYLKECSKHGRILTTDEAFEYYIENVMTTKCQINYWLHDRERKEGTYTHDKYKSGYYHNEYCLWQLSMKAAQWHRQMVGQLVITGKIVINAEQFEVLEEVL